LTKIKTTKKTLQESNQKQKKEQKQLINDSTNNITALRNEIRSTDFFFWPEVVLGANRDILRKEDCGICDLNP
jgi:hypothetical protein